ncbi:CIA30 family protein [Arsukibacterium sp.]|uniref:CIA30 family protein n=1 Tax=Arsukibacterium sp. TaxID=1977258 RepID=UPI00299D4C8B|nr:CIA30 family protein [Arsukibacterium sp.]MDX1537856.1 CIA30 family protein [Arsukibacterium sp.]
MKILLTYVLFILSGLSTMNAKSESLTKSANELPGTVMLEFYNPEDFSSVQLIHDTVMGGRSTGGIKPVSEPAGLRFFGNLSLANNGGFASAEFKLAAALPSPIYRSIKLHIAADGRQYQLRLKTPFLAQGVAYVAEFNSAIDMQNYYFKPADFSGRYRGRLVANLPALSLADVSHISVMLADGQSGTFSIILYSLSLSSAQTI